MALNEITEMAEQGPETAEGIEVIFLSEKSDNYENHDDDVLIQEVIHGLGSLLQPSHYLVLELEQRLIPHYQAKKIV